MTTEKKSPASYMEEAYKEALKAFDEGEVPVGCVVVRDGRIVARAHNTVEKDGCAISHAEINAIGAATEATGGKFLTDCDIYVTVEPCAMCAGAIVNSRLRKLYYGTEEPKTGCCGSLYDIVSDSRLNGRTPSEGGLMAEKCRALLQKFFDTRREKC